MPRNGRKGPATRRSKNRGRSNRNFSSSSGGERAIVPFALNRSPDFCMPRQRTHFAWESVGTYNTATALAPFSTSRYLPTRLQDFDPAAGSTAVPGLVAWSGLYRKYRPQNGTLTTTFVNLETFPVEAFSIAVNYDPVGIAPQQFLSNPLCKKFLLAPKGGMDRATLKSSFSITKFAGSASFQVDDDYVGNVDGSSNPTNNVYFYQGIRNPPATASVSGVYAQTTLRVTADLFEVQTPAS